MKHQYFIESEMKQLTPRDLIALEIIEKWFDIANALPKKSAKEYDMPYFIRRAFRAFKEIEETPIPEA